MLDRQKDRKTININFCGFWSSFNKTNNLFYKILSKRYNVILSDSPDYIIISANGKPFEYMKYNCIRIFYSGEEIVPDFNLFDYAIGFDDFQFGDRYLRFPFCYFKNDLCETHLGLDREKAISLLSKKDIFCNLIYWEDSIGNFRSELFNAISKYKQVDSYGRLLNNVGGTGVSYKEKYELLKRSKFTIAVEGCNYPGITTEKIFQPFEVHSVPIFYGNSDIEKDFSARAFVNCHNYRNIDEIVEAIKELDTNDEKYLDMLCASPLLDDKQLIDVEKQLEEFLFHIFDQEIESCKRRVDSPISRTYNQNARIARRFCNMKTVQKLIK